jgi:hypothetical protein
MHMTEAEIAVQEAIRYRAAYAEDQREREAQKRGAALLERQLAEMEPPRRRTVLERIGEYMI